MKVAVIEAAQGGSFSWSNRDHITPQDLADLWASGVYVAACGKESGTEGATLKFQQADALMVRISLDRLPLETALGAGFTQRYAFAAAYSAANDGKGELLLAFSLPEPVTSRATYLRLLAGIEAIYAGSASHKSAEQDYGLAAGTGIGKALGGKLDAATVRRLEKLGRESSEIGDAQGGYLRSKVKLDRTDVLKLPDGEECTLEHLPKDAEVFCPVHVGSHPAAVVHWYGDGTPGVQCSHCGRTYAATTTTRDYDFGRFDRTIKELAEERASLSEVHNGMELATSGITYFAEQYLPELHLEPGVTFVKSPKGTGKTEALVKLVERCKKEHLRVLLLGHRRSLLQSMATRLGIDCYFIVETKPERSKVVNQGSDDKSDCWLGDALGDLVKTAGALAEKKQDAGYRRVPPTKRYALCVNSMMELDPTDDDHQYHVVIIDEAEQVFSHLIGDVNLKKLRRQVYATMSYYLRSAPCVYLLDADMNMVTMTAAFEMFQPDKTARVIVNEPPLKQETIYRYGNRGQLAKLLIDRAGAGEKVFVATNSKRKAVDFGKMLLERYPSLRLKVVTSDNSQSEEVQELLGDITNQFENHLDVLVSSPAIGTGIDITFKDESGVPRRVVDSVFGFFEGNIVTHFDIDQQLMRVRHPGEVHVWVDTTPMNYETDTDCIKRELANTVRRTNFLLHYKDSGEPVFAHDHGLVNIWAEVLAASRGSKNRLADLFSGLRAGAGWQVIDVEHDKGAAAVGRELVAAAKEARLAERQTNLLAAPKLSFEEASDLRSKKDRGLSLSNADQAALERFGLEDFYAEEDISPNLIDFDDEGRKREMVKRLECLTAKREWVETQDENDLGSRETPDMRIAVFDRRHMLAQRQILEVLLSSAGVFDAESRQFKAGASVETSLLTPFVDVLESRRAQFEALFGIPVYQDCRSKPIGQLKCVLKLIGLDLDNTETVQKGGKKVRYYSIPPEVLDAMNAVVKSRDAKFQRDNVTRSRPSRKTSSLSQLLKQHGAQRLSDRREQSVVAASCSGAPT